jgi:hypothetical protein
MYIYSPSFYYSFNSASAQECSLLPIGLPRNLESLRELQAQGLWWLLFWAKYAVGPTIKWDMAITHFNGRTAINHPTFDIPCQRTRDR